jgi:hypothetical protein
MLIKASVTPVGHVHVPEPEVFRERPNGLPDPLVDQEGVDPSVVRKAPP